MKMYTVTQEDLALALGRVRISGGIRFPQFEIGLDIDLRAFLKVTKVVIRVRAEREDVVPGGRSLRASWSSVSTTPSSL